MIRLRTLATIALAVVLLAVGAAGASAHGRHHHRPYSPLRAPVIERVFSEPATLCTNAAEECGEATAVAICPTGTQVVGGGIDTTANPVSNATLIQSMPVFGTEWIVTLQTNEHQIGSAVQQQTFLAVAICLRSGR